MISYEPFWEEMKAKSITTYALINDYGISASLIDRLKHNRPISFSDYTITKRDTLPDGVELIEMV